MRKNISIALALILLISTGSVFAETVDYEESWAKDEIAYMVDKGIISGYPDGTFKPDNNVTNAEFYRLVNALLGYTETEEINYDDVKLEDWFYEEVQKAAKANYLPTVKRFNPNENITRGEVGRIIGFVYDVEEDIVLVDEFKDSEDIAKEIKAILGGLKKKGYIVGYPDGSFRPDSEITRAEVVRILYIVSLEELKADQEVKTDETDEKEEAKEKEKKTQAPVKEEEDRKQYTNKDESEIYIYFKTPVDRDRAEDPTNYLFRKEIDGKVYDLTDFDGEVIVDSDGERVILKLIGFKGEGYKYLELSQSLRDIDDNRLSGDRIFEIIDDKNVVPLGE